MSNGTLSHNTSKAAVTHSFEVQPDSIIIANTRPVGGVTINSTAEGINYPNTQSAIDDLTSMVEQSVGSVIINTTGTTPQGNSQVDDFTFTGVVKHPTKSTGDPVDFNFYGFPVVVNVGDTGEEVAAKVKLKLDAAAGGGLVFNSVSHGATLDIIQVTYTDYQPHILPTLSQYTLKVTQSQSSPAKPGYGAWVRIGTQTLTLDGSTAPVTLFYFKREA